MTTSVELDARGQCDDLRREVATLRGDLSARNAQVHRLNAMLVSYEKTIDAQAGIIAKLRGDLSTRNARAEKTLLDAQELPY